MFLKTLVSADKNKIWFFNRFAQVADHDKRAYGDSLARLGKNSLSSGAPVFTGTR